MIAKELPLIHGEKNDYFDNEADLFSKTSNGDEDKKSTNIQNMNNIECPSFGVYPLGFQENPDVTRTDSPKGILKDSPIRSGMSKYSPKTLHFDHKISEDLEDDENQSKSPELQESLPNKNSKKRPHELRQQVSCILPNETDPYKKKISQFRSQHQANQPRVSNEIRPEDVFSNNVQQKNYGDERSKSINIAILNKQNQVTPDMNNQDYPR